jgi:prolyl oligopeptidase
VRDIYTGKDLGDEIKWVKFSAATWTKDGKGFFYTKFDAPEEGTSENAGTETQRLSSPKQMYHKIGTKQAEDILVFEQADHPDYKHSLFTTRDDDYLILTTIRGASSENLVSYAKMPKEINGKIDFKPLITNWEGQFGYLQNEGNKFFFDTTYKAPRTRTIMVDLERPDEKDWLEVIPEPEGNAVSMGGMVLNNYTIIQTYMKDVANGATVWELPTKANELKKAKRVGELELPGIGSFGMTGGRWNESLFQFTFSSLTNPGSMYQVDLSKSLKYEAIRKADLPGYDDEDFITDRVFYKSKDGTEVPIFLVRHKDVLPTLDSKPEGPIPTLLFVYGGFGVSNPLTFSQSRRIWMQNYRGMFGYVSLRGGGEYGEEWHMMGAGANRQNCFDDLHYAAKFLQGKGYTTPKFTAINGGSNGGTVVAVAGMQEPDLYGAVVSDVPVTDMLRFQHFTIGHAWTGEYGSSENPSDFDNLYRYSPLHNVKPVKYPAMLVTTGDHDDRVVPLHSYKFVATMQAIAG